jgi:flagellar hook-associated protein 2
MKLSNSGAGTVTSAGRLGTVTQTAPLSSGRLNGSITAVDGSGNGSFSINGVSIAYNVNNDSLSGVLDRITQSTAGVTATYDALNDKVILTNKSTGNMGIALNETGGGLLDALNLSTTVTSPGSLVAGTDAKFRVNDGDWISSTSNTFDSTVHGITGLSITANSTGTQTLSVQSDTSTMQTSIQDFITKFNSLQDLIEDKTKADVQGTTVNTGVLYNNREVQTWARQLHQMAFGQIPGVTGSITHLDDLGIDFDGTTGHLAIKNEAKLNTALANNPADVQSYFNGNGFGLVPSMYGMLTTLMTDDTSAADRVRKTSLDIDGQITTLQARLDAERESLTNSFIGMLDAQSAAQSQNQALTNAFFKNNSS